MKFLLDAQLPRRLIPIFQSLGHDAVHTLDLPNKNKTSDNEIIDFAMAVDLVVVTKDADFVDAFYLRGQPKHLMLVSTGNINNKDLENLLRRYLATIVDLFAEYNFVELSQTEIIAHS